MIIKELKTKLGPAALYKLIRGRFENTFLLESSEGPERFIRHSILGFAPQATISLKDGRMLIKGNADSIGAEGDMSKKDAYKTDDPAKEIKELLAALAIKEHSYRYVGGLVGYFSYDFIRYAGDVRLRKKDGCGFPDFEFGLFYDGIIYDNLNRTVAYFSQKTDRFAKIKGLLREERQRGAAASESGSTGATDVDAAAPARLEAKTWQKSADDGRLSVGKFMPNMSQKEYERAVVRAKDYIYEGDIFQAVLSKRKTAKYKGDLFDFYKNLRMINPSPYMYYIDFGERKIIGSSPEMLGRAIGRLVETFPIAGTRPVGDTRFKTLMYQKELLADEKERAEHNMLVDLARNDIGRVSKYGSVRVPEYMAVEKYSHVQHIVSKVVGEIEPGNTAMDAFTAIFPAGTVSGAPKIRAMEIIDELEKSRRGPYAGAVGYFSLNGNMDSAITIRTAIADAKNHLIHLQAGAGIVADSNPKKEWEETEHKLGAVMAALNK